MEGEEKKEGGRVEFTENKSTFDWCGEGKQDVTRKCPENEQKKSSLYFPFCTIKDKTCLTFKCQLDKSHFERTPRKKGKSCYSS